MRMRRFIKKHNIFFCTLLYFAVAKVFVFFAFLFSIKILPTNSGFLSSTRFANFDGTHYLAIAENGYEHFQQAFFPLYPILIRYTSKSLSLQYELSGLFISNVSFFLFLYFLQKYLLSKFNKKITTWIVFCFISLPMSFFMQTVYTESLFLFLAILAIFFFNNKKFLLCFIVLGFLSAVRVNGIFLNFILLIVFIYKYRVSRIDTLRACLYGLIGSSGLILYMVYLNLNYSDALLFIHSQNAFGANRATDTFIFLPQVFFRYIKIFFTVSFTSLTLWVSVTEFVIFNLALFLSAALFKKKGLRSVALFSSCSLLLPTLTGTLSSIPRYSLLALAVPIIFPFVTKRVSIKVGILFLLFLLQFVFASIYFAGFFVS